MHCSRDLIKAEDNGRIMRVLGIDGVRYSQEGGQSVRHKAGALGL